MSEQNSENNKIIAKNTLMLYLRMFLVMIVGLYTSRVILATLGIEDYGIYGIVGGVVGMLGFLNSSMSGATSRFITYELGRGDKERLCKTFSSAMVVHIIISLIVLAFAETIGLWYVQNKLVIPDGRLNAALVVYQFSIYSAILNITQVPYSSCLIAHERMGVYAYVEILNITLKLVIVYLLLVINCDKLIIYSVLHFATSFIILITYRIYCVRVFDECRFHLVWDKTYLKPLLSFSGWNLFGNFGNIVGNQATNFVINSFFGVVMNAAASIALNIAGIVTQFASNAMTAFRPQITKAYAREDVQGMQSLTLLALKIIMVLYTLVAIPVFLECDYLLNLWLVEVPSMASTFCRILLISIFFESMRYIIIMDIHASGNVKMVSACAGTFFITSPIFTYILFKLGLPVIFSFIVITTINAVLLLINVLIAKHYIHEIETHKYFTAIATVIFTSTLPLIILHFFKQLLPESFVRLCLMTFISLIVQFILFTFVSLSTSQRKSIFNFIREKIHI